MQVIYHEFSQEERAELLQFSTGTSRVPVQGFACLQGSDGNIKPFCIEGMSIHMSAHMSVHVSIGMSVHMSVQKSMHTQMSIHMPLHMPLGMSIGMSMHMSIHMSMLMPIGIDPFCIKGVRRSDTIFPRAHTCFKSKDQKSTPASRSSRQRFLFVSLNLVPASHVILLAATFGSACMSIHIDVLLLRVALGIRIELPLYNTKEELKHFVKLAISMESTGFGIE